jgi:5-methylthioadenosine/S-adenosylhomocysteine deaminase
MIEASVLVCTVHNHVELMEVLRPVDYVSLMNLYLRAASDFLVDVGGFHCQPVHDLAAALAYSVQPTDVRTTIVNGNVLMRDRELLTIDRQALLGEFRARAREITDRSHGRSIQDYQAH